MAFGFDIQYRSKGSQTYVVPAKGLATLPQPGMAAHQTTVGVFAAGVLGQDLLAVDDTALIVASVDAPTSEFAQDGEIRILQRLPLQQYPLLVRIVFEVVASIQALRQ